MRWQDSTERWSVNAHHSTDVDHMSWPGFGARGRDANALGTPEGKQSATARAHFAQPEGGPSTLVLSLRAPNQADFSVPHC